MLPVVDEKETSKSNPVVVIQSPQEMKKKMSPTKKYVIIGVTSFFLLALLLTGILVGMYIFTSSQMEMLEYTLKLSGGRTQEVTSDVSNNVVKYHVTDKEHEAWVVSDFNRNIKVTKILKNGLINCYLTPLNKSSALEPSLITKPDKTDIPEPSKHASLVYEVSGDPVSDISFLAKDARDMCKGVSTYWMHPSCDGKLPNSNTTLRTKREAPYYVYSEEEWGGVYYPCINGCCRTVCACQIYYTWYISGGRIYCQWFYYTCCPGTSYCYFNSYCRATPGLECSDGYC